MKWSTQAASEKARAHIYLAIRERTAVSLERLDALSVAAGHRSQHEREQGRVQVAILGVNAADAVAGHAEVLRQPVDYVQLRGGQQAESSIDGENGFKLHARFEDREHVEL